MDRESGWREFLYYQIKCLFLVLNDKIWVFSSEILGTISYTEDVFEILFYFIYWYCCDMLFTHNSSASLMRVYWKPFLILSPGARCQCRGSPVPRSQWRTVTDHSGHWWPWHSAAEASLGAGDFGHCVQELCFVFCYLATHGKNIHLSSKWLCWLGITEWRIKIMSSCWFDCVSDEMLLCSHSPVGGAGHNGAMSIRRIIYNWFFIVIVP